MAWDTSKALRQQVMYCVYVRQYSKEGTFEKVREDLTRIRDLGVDILWLLPIHPIGKTCRKGVLGSPYAIRDYRAVNEEYGTMQDFERLAGEVHRLGMRLIIDVVYNHTSPDSWLAQNHPEWFYHKADGSFGNRIGEWSDIIDLDYNRPELWDYQIETLKMWASMVDGFRCDVAPLVPLDFWLRARRKVSRVRPDCLWLSESVEPEFTLGNRARGMVSLSDSEIYQAFDLSYEYDVYHDWVSLLCGEKPLDAYAAALSRQEYLYPDNYVKLRFLENHDRPRAAFLVPDALQRRNWLAFLYFQKGMTLIYNGQEASCESRPSLFDKDPIDWQAGEDISPQLRALRTLRSHPLMAEGSYSVQDAGNGILRAMYARGERRLMGIFSTRGTSAPVRVPFRDGRYCDLVSRQTVQVEGGLLSVKGEPIVIDSETEGAP